MEYMSQEGYDELVAELQHMVNVELPAVRDAIAEARDKGVETDYSRRYHEIAGDEETQAEREGVWRKGNPARYRLQQQYQGQAILRHHRRTVAAPSGRFQQLCR